MDGAAQRMLMDDDAPLPPRDSETGEGAQDDGQIDGDAGRDA